jgi:two-component system OmpR family response regulator
MRILIVEDDDLLADGLARSLRQSGYAVDWASSGEQADNWLLRENYDLVILDLSLPKMDGTEVLRRLRRREQPVPVLILTARDALEDRVSGLDLGADDYVVKPVAFLELEARVRALIRRGQGMTSPVTSYGPLALDTVGKRAWLRGEPLDLSAREWGVLEYLLPRAGRIVGKEQILQALCGWDGEISLNAIEKYVSRLRAKLEPAGVRIRAVRGLGYYMEKPDD